MAETDRNIIKTFDENIVKHQGIVSKISSNSITVSLQGNLHCEACNAKSACGVSDSDSKEIEVNAPAQSLKLNENVEVFLKKDLGLKAVFWAYVFPFVLLFSVLLIASSMYPEWIAGLLAIGVLIPYYLLLYVLKNSFKNTFKVSVSKIS
jgi:sigma-E factor negative regulatory protein RseC